SGRGRQAARRPAAAGRTTKIERYVFMADEKKWEGTQDIPAAEPETAAAPGAAEPLPPPEDGEMRMPARKRKLPRSKKRIAAIAAALCAAAAVLAAVVWGGMRFFGGGSGTGEVLTAVV